MTGDRGMALGILGLAQRHMDAPIHYDTTPHDFLTVVDGARVGVITVTLVTDTRVIFTPAVQRADVAVVACLIGTDRVVTETTNTAVTGVYGTAVNVITVALSEHGRVASSDSIAGVMGT
jgi:hypothetical protein